MVAEPQFSHLAPIATRCALLNSKCEKYGPSMATAVLRDAGVLANAAIAFVRQSVRRSEVARDPFDFPIAVARRVKSAPPVNFFACRGFLARHGLFLLPGKTPALLGLGKRAPRRLGMCRFSRARRVGGARLAIQMLHLLPLAKPQGYVPVPQSLA